MGATGYLAPMDQLLGQLGRELSYGPAGGRLLFMQQVAYALKHWPGMTGF
jgi:hypothetical protein